MNTGKIYIRNLEEGVFGYPRESPYQQPPPPPSPPPPQSPPPPPGYETRMREQEERMRQKFAEDIKKASLQQQQQQQQQQKQYIQPIPRRPPVGYNRADQQAYKGECYCTSELENVTPSISISYVYLFRRNPTSARTATL